MNFSEFLQTCRYMQYVCVITVALLQMSISMAGSWMSPVLPLLTSESSPLGQPLTKVQETWIVAGEKLGSLIGCLIAALLTDRIGRKRILLLAAVPFCISMMGAALITSANLLIALRVIGGLGTGIVVVVLPLYVGEIAEKDIRGRLNVLHIIMSTLGSTFVYSVGPFISYVALSVTCGAIPILFVVIFMFMPDSPYFLIKRNRVLDASQSLERLSQKNIKKEIIVMRLQEIENFNANGADSKANFKELFINRTYRKSILISLVLFTILILSGGFVISSYLQKIIENSDSSISPQLSSVVFGVIKLPSVLLAAFLVDKFGRRPLMMVSSSGCALALIAEGVYFYLQEHNYNIAQVSWLPTTGLSLYLFFSYFGIHVLPGVIMGEIFTINIKSMASSFASIYMSALSFLLFKFFKPLSDELGIHTMFWIFGAMCILGFFFGMFLLPETKGRSFAEIQDLLNKRKKTRQKNCTTQL